MARRRIRPITMLFVLSMVITTISGCALFNNVIVVPPNVKEGSAVGDTAYDFSVPTTDGGEVTLSEFRGQVVLIEFWASWCGPCRTSMPHINNLWEDFHEQGFTVIAVSADSTQQAATEFLESNGYDGFISVWESREKETRIIQTYEIEWIPRSVVVDKQGIVRYNGHAMGLEASVIVALLAE